MYKSFLASFQELDKQAIMDLLGDPPVTGSVLTPQYYLKVSYDLSSQATLLDFFFLSIKRGQDMVFEEVEAKTEEIHSFQEQHPLLVLRMPLISSLIPTNTFQPAS